MKIETITLNPECENIRLDKFLSNHFPEHSRSYFQFLIEKGHVLIDNKPAKKRHMLSSKEKLSIAFVLPPAVTLEAEEIALEILYEDDFLIVINKPAGLVVHPGAGNWKGTLINGLMHHCSVIENPEETLRPGIVHRLDKETSGLLVVAKKYETQKKLVNLFSSRQVKKTYLAICVGNPGSQTIEAPIGRHPRKRKQMTIIETGRAATTTFETLSFDGKISLVTIDLKTGRTHQIRVHMQHHRTPVLGDSTYGSLAYNRKYQTKRQLLHAHKLAFVHPETSDLIELEAPIPKDFTAFPLLKSC